MTYAALEITLARWAATQPGLRALVVVGSRARLAPPPDEWSDLDLILFVRDPQPFVSSDTWIRALGEPWLTVLDQTGAGEPEWFALFAGGLKADFVVSRADPAAASLDAILRASPYHSVYQRGVRVLYDAAGPAQPPRPLTPPPSRADPQPQPSAHVFEQHIRQTLLSVNRTARLCRRGDHWRARDHHECRLRRQLLAMLEWHARAHAAPAAPPDTWHDGRYLERWADPRAVAELPRTMASSEPASLWPALLASLDLYGWLARETASRWSLPYPAAAEEHLRQWLSAIAPAPT